MKKSTIVRALILPLVCCVLTSCEPNGQLLTGGVCAGVFATGLALASLVGPRSRRASAI